LLPLPFGRHQIIPLAAQCSTDSGNGRNQDIDFSGFYPSDGARIDVSQLSQPLLRHSQRSADAPDAVSELPNLGRQFGFGHASLPEKFDVDLKGVMRPNFHESKAQKL
jgi:hypothetical protein